MVYNKGNKVNELVGANPAGLQVRIPDGVVLAPPANDDSPDPGADRRRLVDMSEARCIIPPCNHT